MFVRSNLFNLLNWYYQYDRGGGDGDEICGDSRFFVFLGSKSKFLLA